MCITLGPIPSVALDETLQCASLRETQVLVLSVTLYSLARLAFPTEYLTAGNYIIKKCGLTVVQSHACSTCCPVI